MDELLQASTTRRLHRDEAQLTPLTQASPKENLDELPIDSADNVLKILQSKPSFEALGRCLRWLTSSDRNKSDGFNITIPSPQVAQTVNALVNEILPNFWHLLEGNKDLATAEQKSLLLKCLSSITGIGALAARLRALTAAFRGPSHDQKTTPRSDGPQLQETVDVLQLILQGNKTVLRIWKDNERFIDKAVQRTLLCKELVSWLSSGRLLSVAAEALHSKDLHAEKYWIGDGRLYSRWLGQNVKSIAAISNTNASKECKFAAQLLGKALSLGYIDQLLEAAFSGSLNGDPDGLLCNLSLFDALALHEQKNAFFALLRILSNRLTQENAASKEQVIFGAAAFVQAYTKDKAQLLNALLDWLYGSGGSITLDIGVHRAVIVVLSRHDDLLTQAVNRLLSRFGDKLYIQNTPVLYQEVCTQDLLLLLGYFKRSAVDGTSSITRSSVYVNAISNRLAASSQRAQFLGMLVGMLTSELFDKPDTRMKFSSEDLNGSGSKFYRDLINMRDSIGSIKDLKPKSVASTTINQKKPVKKSPPTLTQSKAPDTKIVAIEELAEDSESEDDIPVYEKPDSDQEDEDEDPTLIQRNKPQAPVYIRDLIAGLRDSENYERHRLAISTSKDLIRRKSNFGTEVTDHIEELATQMVGLKDEYDLENFQEMRVQSMIAIIIAQPLQMARWFSNTLFNGDYSMSQRASILTALSMAARELAGYREGDAALTGAHTPQSALFPSKKLPAAYEKIYAVEARPVDAMAKRLEQTMIQPVAAEAADAVTGPNALKVRTFSSRMEVERKRKRPITNELAKIVADGFFFPLTGRWKAHMQAYGDRSVFSTAFLQAHFLKSLALILNASGTSTLSLPALTTEFWAFLLSMRASALDAAPVLEALLFSLLTVLDINANDQRRVAEDHSRELVETQAWVERVFENLGGGSEEDDRVRSLAAAVLVRCKEIVDKYQRLLMGDLVGLM